MPRETFQPAVYILTNRPNDTLYLGCTTNLPQRVYQHKLKLAEGFTKEHEINLLVWFELHEEMGHAILREKQIKSWKRVKKLALIEAKNREWLDLSPTIF